MRDAVVIEDLETLRAMAEPTRMAILELLVEPRSVTELAEELGAPRTRLYHHVELLQSKGLIEVAEERRVGAMTERLYAPTAKTFRPSKRLMATSDVEERVEAVAAIVLDATRADLSRAARAGVLEDEGGLRVQAGRSIAHLTGEQAAAIAATVGELVAQFDAGHEVSDSTRPYALAWALYPTTGRAR